MWAKRAGFYIMENLKIKVDARHERDIMEVEFGRDPTLRVA